MPRQRSVLILVLILFCVACTMRVPPPPSGRTRIILDTDANNELDDQHAIAYLLFSGDVFDVEGITVNRTRAGGALEQHVDEAERVVSLAGLHDRIPVIAGADGSFDEIAPHLGESGFDGAAAVDFIIERAHASDPRKLVLLPIGKLTNVALALKKDPSIADKLRIVWLGSNYPDPGEYNQDNDPAALNFLLESEVDFEIVLVRYGEPSGTDAVRVTLEEIRARMPGKGPRAQEPISGRNGGQFSTFGDYSLDLFENIELQGENGSRALYDMAAVAIVKEPTWARPVRIPAPRLEPDGWVQRRHNPRTVVLWEYFDRDAIVKDFFRQMEEPVLAR